MPQDAGTLLDACGLPMLAKHWARDNFAFPWANGKSKTDWPLWTVLAGADLRAVSKELASFTKARLAAVPDGMFAADEAATIVSRTRDELWKGLVRLRTWVGKAQKPEPTAGMGWKRRGNALVLKMDGDQ